MNAPIADVRNHPEPDSPPPDPARLLRHRWAPPAGWLVLVLSCYWLAEVGQFLGLPAPELMIPLLVGAVLALSGLVRRPLPAPAGKASQALVGVLMGSYLDPDALQSVAATALPLSVVTVLTIGISLGVAALLARTSRLTFTDATLGTVPGGSAAIIACSDELGADSRRVAFAQYLRVGLVAVTAPAIAAAFRHGPLPEPPARGIGLPLLGHVVADPHGVGRLLILLAVCLLGAQAGRRLRLPSPVLLGPMLLTVLVVFTDTADGFAPAGPLQDVVFALIGLEVGLRFTLESVRHVGRLVPHLLAATVVMCALCAGLAALFIPLLGLSFIEAYLATTPGGINAVLATAAATDTNVPVVSTVQALRLFVVVLVVPIIIRWLTRRYGGDAPGTPSTGAS